uniref:Uncharacterized protein n=1 Tax=Rhizophora mucronata TaxID=61149 RepID=A0A2P2NVB8_RHIMU
MLFSLSLLTHLLTSSFNSSSKKTKHLSIGGLPRSPSHARFQDNPK